MKKFLLGVVIALLSMSILFFVADDSESEARIGILDRQQILNESQRAQELEAELSEIGDQLETEYRNIEEEGEGPETEEELENIYQQYVMNKENLEEKLNNEINEIINEIAAEKNYEVILLKESTKFGGEEITSQIIERLDERY